MKTKYKILIITIPIALIVSYAYINTFSYFVLDYTSNGTPYDLEIIFHEEEYAVEYFVINGSTDFVEIDIPTDLIDGVFMIHVNSENIDDERVSIDGNNVIVNYGQNIETVKLFGSYDLGELESEPEVKNMQCIPTDYEKTRKCLASYHCDVDTNPALNEECIEIHNGISVREMCSDPDNIIIQKTNGCMVLPLVGSKSCGLDYACTEESSPEMIILDDTLERILESCSGKFGIPLEKKTLWINETHKITSDVCELEKRTNSGVSIDRTPYPTPIHEPTTQSEVIKSIALDNVPYQKLIEDEQEYVGQMLRYYGKISNVDNNKFTDSTATIAVTPAAGWVDPIELTYNDFELKDDTLKRIWGTYTGINKVTDLPMIQIFIVQ